VVEIWLKNMQILGYIRPTEHIQESCKWSRTPHKNCPPRPNH